MESVFEEWNAYASKKTLKNRDINLNNIETNSKLKIIPITGIRRSGKSSVLILLQQKLNKEGKKVAYVQLEDSRIKNDKEILDKTLKWFGDSGYLLLDEITSVNDWEGWLARNHEMLKGKLNLIISSSRKSLVIPNKPLRGRMLPYEFYPLTFKEFLSFKEANLEKTTAGIGRIENLLEEYLIYGGYPEVALTKDYLDKISLINTYFKDIIGLDIAELSKENISLVETFSKYLLESTYFSASKCLNYFKTLGYKIGKQSLLNLEKYSQMSYLFFFIQIFSNNIKDRNQYPRKVYSGDTGFINAISGKKDMGKLYENAVLLTLKRQLPKNREINYWKNSEGTECDFIVREGLNVKEIIQVVYELESEETRKREIKGIIACANNFKLKEGLIITKSVEKTEKFNGIKVHFIPLWKWLLKDKK
jgi:predicted AAA+ superfamily ATPase